MIKEPVIDELVARKFLLGQLSPEEQGQIEELAFEDPDTFAFLESVEEDLVDEFLQDELSPLERQRFNDYFLSFPGRRQNLKISEVLQQHFNPVTAEVITAGPQKREVVADVYAQKSSFRRFIDSLKVPGFWLKATTAAILVALLLFAVWRLIQKEKQPDPVQAGPGTPVNVPSPEPQISPSLHPSPSPVQANNKRRSPTPVKQKPKPALEKQEAVAPYVVALLIPSAVPRGGDVQPLQLPPDASSVPVGLALVDDRNFKTYEVALQDEAGKELDHWHDRRAQNFPTTKGLLIDVRTRFLKPDGFYRILVTGVSSKGERSRLTGYSFEAKK